MIEMGKKYQTRGDDVHPSVPVRILATDMRNGYDGVQVVALLSCGKEEKLLITDLYGNSNVEKGLDLVPVPTKHEAWAVVINDRVFPGPCMVFNTKEGAEHHAKVCAGSLAYVAHVTWED